MIYGSYYVNSGFYIKTIAHGNQKEKKITLTFDDGPDKIITPAILDILKKHEIKATFFPIGKSAESHPDIIKRIKEEKHIIGNHSYSHSKWFDFWSPQAMYKDFLKAHEVIFNITGENVQLFRPPYGVTNPLVQKAFNRTKYICVGWSLRSLDSSIRNKNRLFNRIVSKVKGGDIILLHSNVNITLEILEKLINSLEDKNFEFVQLDELVDLKLL